MDSCFPSGTGTGSVGEELASKHQKKHMHACMAITSSPGLALGFGYVQFRLQTSELRVYPPRPMEQPENTQIDLDDEKVHFGRTTSAGFEFNL